MHLLEMEEEAQRGEILCIIENFTQKKVSKRSVERAVWETVQAMRERTRTKKNVLYLYVAIVGVKRSAQLNDKFRGIKKPTDVFSFSPSDYLPSRSRVESDPCFIGERMGVRFDRRPIAGEIVLCPQVVQRHARENHRSFQDEWTHVLVHGTLHVLGYHHEESAKRERDLKQKENSICKKLGYRIPHPEV